MPTLASEYDLSLQLSASAVDAKKGLIRGVTVAQAGVEATGKFILLDAEGNLTRDPLLAKRKLQVYTDQKTLDTLMAAAKVAGGRSKSREDHNEELGARIGFADNFAMQDGKVVCDLHVFDAYRNRELLLETADKTPEEVGISIDMDPSFEIFNDRALMRIEELHAVDVVDEGAITHAGLFLSRGVDKLPQVKLATTQTSPAMADAPAQPTLQDCMSAISALTSSVSALAGTVSQLQQQSAGASQMAATLTEINGKLSAQAGEIATIKQTAAALGQRPGNGGGANADAASETERQRLSAEQARAAKTYPQLVEDEKAARKADLDSGKLKAGDVHKLVMNAHPEKYREHLKATGVYDPARDTAHRVA